MSETQINKNKIIELAIEVCRKAPRELLLQICESLKRTNNSDTIDQILQRLPTTVNGDLAFLLKNYLQLITGTMQWSMAGWSLETAALTLDKNGDDEFAEIVWTGPTTGTYSVRRTDQVLYDLIIGAKRDILLITFAAAKIERLKKALVEASKNGVKIRLVLEFEEESEGQLSKDALDAFAGSIENTADIYYWPIEKRERNSLNKPGKLHAKCAVVDNVLLLSSANLTDDAFNRNMELGVLIRKGSIPKQILTHIDELVRCGVLVPWRMKL